MSNAVPEDADPLAKIGDLAASAGVRRIHVLAWRDLDDVEAGGSEVHIAEVAKLWAAAGLEITMRTSWAQGQPTEAMRDGYKVIRRAGRYQVFPRAALAEIAGRTGPRDVLVEIWNGMPFLSPLWNPGPRVILLHHVHAEMWNMTLGPKLGPLGALFEAKIAPPLYRRSAVATLCESSKTELVEDLGFDPERVTVVHPGIDPRYTPGGARSPEPLVMAVGRMAPVKRYDMLVRAAHHARATRARPAPAHRGRRLRPAHGQGRHRRARRPRLGHPAGLAERGGEDRPVPAGVGHRLRVRPRGLGHDADRGGGLRHPRGGHRHRRAPRLGARRRDRAAGRRATR